MGLDPYILWVKVPVGLITLHITALTIGIKFFGFTLTCSFFPISLLVKNIKLYTRTFISMTTSIRFHISGRSALFLNYFSTPKNVGEGYVSPYPHPLGSPLDSSVFFELIHLNTLSRVSACTFLAAKKIILYYFVKVFTSFKMAAVKNVWCGTAVYFRLG